MNISRLFILRPVATSLLMIALVLVGLVAVRFLPVSSLPNVDYPTIQVQTFYPGASPDVMATTVTAPLEVQLGEIPGLQQMVSYSSEGASVITLQFDLSLNLDIAEQNVQQAINAANSFLPSRPARAADLRQGQSGRPADPHARGHVEVDVADAVAGHRQQPPRAPRFRKCPGVGLVTTAGGNVPAMRVEADPHKLAAYGLNIDDLRTLLSERQRQSAEGQFRRPGARLHDQRQRPDRRPEGLSGHRDRVPERRAGVHARRRAREPGRAGRRARRVVQRHARDRAERAAPAGRERDRDREPDHEAVAAARIDAAGRHAGHGGLEQHRRDPLVGLGRRVRTGARDRAGGAGDLRVPAQRAGDASSRASPCRCR